MKVTALYQLVLLALYSETVTIGVAVSYKKKPEILVIRPSATSCQLVNNRRKIDKESKPIGCPKCLSLIFEQKITSLNKKAEETVTSHDSSLFYQISKRKTASHVLRGNDLG